MWLSWEMIANGSPSCHMGEVVFVEGYSWSTWAGLQLDRSLGGHVPAAESSRSPGKKVVVRIESRRGSGLKYHSALPARPTDLLAPVASPLRMSNISPKTARPEAICVPSALTPDRLPRLGLPRWLSATNRSHKLPIGTVSRRASIFIVPGGCDASTPATPATDLGSSRKRHC